MYRCPKTTRIARAAAALTVLALPFCLAQGCKPKDASGDTALKQQLSNPKKFDINDVPPDKRDMVRALMKGNGGSSPNGMAAAAAHPAATK